MRGALMLLDSNYDDEIMKNDHKWWLRKVLNENCQLGTERKRKVSQINEEANDPESLISAYH